MIDKHLCNIKQIMLLNIPFFSLELLFSFFFISPSHFLFSPLFFLLLYLLSFLFQSDFTFFICFLSFFFSVYSCYCNNKTSLCSVLSSSHSTWPKQFKQWKVPTVVGSIVVVGVLTCCALLYSLCNMQTKQMNMQSSLIYDECCRNKQKHLLCKRWRCSWLQYSNQIDNKISLQLQETQR